MTSPDSSSPMQPRTPEDWSRYAIRIREALQDIDRLSNNEKRWDHPDYNLELIHRRLLCAWSPSPITKR